jgi:hypothetical protein
LELEALCKKYANDAQKPREEKTKLEGIIESHDKLIMEFTDKYGTTTTMRMRMMMTEGTPPHPCYNTTPCTYATCCCP